MKTKEYFTYYFTFIPVCHTKTKIKFYFVSSEEDKVTLISGQDYFQFLNFMTIMLNLFLFY